MNNLFRDILDELKQFVTGKTIDALFPPIVYLIGNALFGLETGVILAIGLALILGIARAIRKESIIYALGGSLGVVIASGFALISNSAASYFLPRVIGSGVLFLTSLTSLIIGKPLAAILSHITRGWNFQWFMRKDIKPAYREVTVAWTILLLTRTILQWLLYKRANLVELGWSSIILGFPATLSILILTLIYGIWRLQNLGGPGVDEFEEGKEAPWRGQKKGF